MQEHIMMTKIILRAIPIILGISKLPLVALFGANDDPGDWDTFANWHHFPEARKTMGGHENLGLEFLRLRKLAVIRRPFPLGTRLRKNLSRLS
jgi:hypothetical protein